MVRLLFFSITLLSASLAYAAKPGNDGKDKSGLTYGVGMGVFKASGKNALYYNGAPDKKNNITQVLLNPYTREAINIQFRTDDFKIIEYPSKMKYNTTINMNGMLGYRLINNLLFFSQLEYVKLTTEGAFVVELATPSYSTIETKNQKVVGNIKAQESRFDIAVGVHYALAHEGACIPFVEMTGSVIFTQMKLHEFSIGNFKSSMVNITYANQYSNNTQAGTGYGIATTFGVEGPLKASLDYNVGITASMKKINLDKSVGMVPHGCIFVRFVM